MLGPLEASTLENLCDNLPNQEKSELCKEIGLSGDVRADLIWFLQAQYYAVNGSQEKTNKSNDLIYKSRKCLQTCF